MTHTSQHQALIAQDRYGLSLAARLSGGTAELPHDISERLRVARQQAVACRKQPSVVRSRGLSRWVKLGAFSSAGHGSLGDDEGLDFWSGLAALLPLVALVAGLVVIQAVQNDDRAAELAEVDAALLTDDLPPSAYADAGFVQYLKSTGGHSAPL